VVKVFHCVGSQHLAPHEDVLLLRRVFACEIHWFQTSNNPWCVCACGNGRSTRSASCACASWWPSSVPQREPGAAPPPRDGEYHSTMERRRSGIGYILRRESHLWISGIHHHRLPLSAGRSYIQQLHRLWFSPTAYCTRLVYSFCHVCFGGASRCHRPWNVGGSGDSLELQMVQACS